MSRKFILAPLCAVLGACAPQPSYYDQPAAQTAPQLQPQPQYIPVTSMSAQATLPTSGLPSGFINWRNNFRARALAGGIRPNVFDHAFANVGVNQKVLAADRRQSEFTQQIWEYLDRATSAKRVANGQAKLAEWRQTLDAIERRYGVDRKIVLAVWGMETSYGAVMGDIPVIESMATLAYDGRRKKFAEEQLMAALGIIQSGDISAPQMMGSWAGAMGHTQFIPTSYLAYAVDLAGDGRRDVWSVPDALASTANYLARHGWEYGRPWGVEVQVPAGFNYGMIGQSNRQSAAFWNSQGVRTMSGSAVPNHGETAIIAPAGARGPKFAVFKNFRVIKRYNNATSYAMAVGHLGDKIMGGGQFRAQWPWDEKALRHAEKEELQRLLTARGFDTQGVDGLIGENTVNAVRAYQQSIGITPDGHPGRDVLNRLRGGQ